MFTLRPDSQTGTVWTIAPEVHEDVAHRGPLEENLVAAAVRRAVAHPDPYALTLALYLFGRTLRPGVAHGSRRGPGIARARLTAKT